MSVHQDLEFHLGENWIVDFEVNDGDDENIDITGATLQWRLASPEGDTVMTRTVGDGLTITSGSTGLCTLSVTPVHQSSAGVRVAHQLSMGIPRHHCARHRLGAGVGRALCPSIIVGIMKIKQITIPISQDHPQPTKVSLKSLEGDLDGMVHDLNRHISGAATIDWCRNPGKQDAELAHDSTATSACDRPRRISTMRPHCRPAAMATVGIKVGTSGIGMFFGTGAPTLTAPQGSLYIRSDGTTTNNRFYIRTASGWTAGTTAT